MVHIYTHSVLNECIAESQSQRGQSLFASKPMTSRRCQLSGTGWEVHTITTFKKPRTVQSVTALPGFKMETWRIWDMASDDSRK